MDHKADTQNRIPTNEEIIDELTRDLEASAVRSDISENQPEDSSAVYNDTEHSESDSPDPLRDDDYIDEVYLKDIECSYSEEQKQERREEALKYKETGNAEFKAGSYREAASQYTLALRTCPLSYPDDRAVLYSNRAATKMKLDLYKSGVEDCSKAIELKPDYVKAFYRRAQMYEHLEKLDEALADFQKILELDPSNKEAFIACQRLPGQINERNEKLKTEMMGKLKDLGNLVLRPFGLSTDNFKLNQDPNTGGYNISFQQKS